MNKERYALLYFVIIKCLYLPCSDIIMVFKKQTSKQEFYLLFLAICFLFIYVCLFVIYKNVENYKYNFASEGSLAPPITLNF